MTAARTPPEAAILQLLVGCGLLQFTAEAIDQRLPIFELLRAELQRRDPALLAAPWANQRRILAQAWEPAAGPFSRVGRELSLGQADLFLLGLAGGCETSYLLGLVVAALQSPESDARPSLHLALELRAQLFGVMGEDALTLTGANLFASGVLACPGERPLPQRSLVVRPELWRALRTEEPAWPGCRAIGAADQTDDGEPGSRLAALIAADAAGGLVLRAPPGFGRGALAGAVARALGRVALEVPPAVYRSDLALGIACRTVGWLPVVPVALGPGEAERLVRPDAMPLPTIVLAGPHGAVEGDRLVEVPVDLPTAAERLRLWNAAIGGGPLAADLARTAALPAPAIRRLGRAAVTLAGTVPIAAEHVAEARLRLAPEPLRMLAHPVYRRVGRDALVLPEPLQSELDTLISRCHQRESVWDGAGPSLAATQSRGVRALFAGDSGTGKTLAASYLATALGAPLFRCDLGAVMNKYIGESEKNLGHLLDHAEAADIVLLFDEADALFGRRSEASETGERYANMLTNFLLTRIEAHNGIVVLTANSKGRIDTAFWRRLDAVLDFTAPGYAERLRLWRSHLGGRAPEDAVLHHLASYCDLAGGSIRNAVLAAAAAVPPGSAIGPGALAAALRLEYRKLGRRLPVDLAAVSSAPAAD